MITSGVLAGSSVLVSCLPDRLQQQQQQHPIHRPMSTPIRKGARIFATSSCLSDVLPSPRSILKKSSISFYLIASGSQAHISLKRASHMSEIASHAQLSPIGAYSSGFLQVTVEQKFVFSTSVVTGASASSFVG